MRTIIIILLCMMSFGFNGINANEMKVSDDKNVCVSAGNVDAYIKDSEVNFTNYNKEKVTVSWAVYGHKANGSCNEVTSGTIVLNGNDKNITRSFPKSESFQSYSVRIKVEKCS